MTHIKPEILKKVKQVDLLTYLLNYQPERLKRFLITHTVYVIMTVCIFPMDYGTGSQ